jgi:capsular polysaccharide biosynthesis protein
MRTILVVVCICLVVVAGGILSWCVWNYRADLQVTVSTTITTLPATQPNSIITSVPMVFESEARQREVIAELKGKTVGEAMKMLPCGTGIMSVMATGNDPNELLALVNTAVEKAQQSQPPSEYDLVYTIGAPTKGGLSLKVKDGKVISATFTPEGQ